jgi:hypothetical protein
MTETVFYSPDCFVSPFGEGKFGKAAGRYRRVVGMLEDGTWTVRAAVRSHRVEEPVWMIWWKGIEIEDDNLGRLLDLHWSKMMTFETRARDLRDDGPRVAIMVLARIVPLLPPHVIEFVSTRWLDRLPWIEGTGWEWWKLAMKDLEMKLKGNIPMRTKVEVYSRLLGVFENVIGSIRGGEVLTG